MSSDLAPLGPVSESLDTEIKNWLCLEDQVQAALLAKALIALRNNNGGRVILGVHDSSLESLTNGRPRDIFAAYHPDKIAEIITRFAVPNFPVQVSMKEYRGNPHPVIVVFGGIEHPVITRSGLKDCLRQNAVYMRTVSNGRPSSSEPMRAQDWQSLIDRCFDNREADIGRFVKRHLTGLMSEVQKALGAHAHPGAGASISQSEWLLRKGRQQFEEVWKEKKKALIGEEDVRFHGFYEVAVALVNGHVKKIPLVELPETLFIAQPHMTGWPPWADSRHFIDERLRPYVRDGGWEALIRRVQDQWAQGAIDFWRMEPAGNFYLLRTFEDDTSQTLLRRGVDPGKVFDFVLLISRTAEVIETAKKFCEVIAEDTKQASLLLTFRWSGLRQRKLCCWVEPAKRGVAGLPPEQDEVVAHLLMPLDTPTSAIWEKVQMVTQPVFDIFGVRLPDSTVQEIVTERVQRRA